MPGTLGEEQELLGESLMGACTLALSNFAAGILRIYFFGAKSNPSLRVSSLVLPRGIGIHHAGAELEPAKGDSGVKR